MRLSPRHWLSDMGEVKVVVGFFADLPLMDKMRAAAVPASRGGEPFSAHNRKN